MLVGIFVTKSHISYTFVETTETPSRVTF